MHRDGSSRLVPVLIVGVIVIVAIIALVVLGRALFGGSPAESGTGPSPAKRALVTTDADHSVKMTVRGPLVADEKFRSYMIEVSPTERSMTTFSGYQNQTLENKQYQNNTEAFTQFVYALDKAGLLKEGKVTEAQDDTRGVCAAGRLYTFDVMEAQSSVKSLWTSSCRASAGSYRGNAEQIRTLFLSQIPDSDAMLRTIDLSI